MTMHFLLPRSVSPFRVLRQRRAVGNASPTLGARPLPVRPCRLGGGSRPSLRNRRKLRGASASHGRGGGGGRRNAGALGEVDHPRHFQLYQFVAPVLQLLAVNLGPRQDSSKYAFRRILDNKLVQHRAGRRGQLLQAVVPSRLSIQLQDPPVVMWEGLSPHLVVI